MIIKEIKLDCFRSYEFLEIPINKGINLFYGDNGSGKSSIIESIYFSLTGKSFRTNDTNNLIQKNKNQTQTIIVFDEATSALDNETEEKIIKNLFSYYNEKTFIVIAHKFRDYEKFDSVIQMNKSNFKILKSE